MGVVELNENLAYNNVFTNPTYQYEIPRIFFEELLAVRIKDGI